MVSNRDVEPVTFSEEPSSAQREGSLVWSVARNVTTVLEFGRTAVTTAVDEVGTGVAQRLKWLLGSLADAGGDLAEYVDPGAWLEDLYAVLGIASSGSIVSMEAFRPLSLSAGRTTLVVFESGRNRGEDAWISTAPMVSSTAWIQNPTLVPPSATKMSTDGVPTEST